MPSPSLRLAQSLGRAVPHSQIPVCVVAPAVKAVSTEAGAGGVRDSVAPRGHDQKGGILGLRAQCSCDSSAAAIR
jgi:hypothetical protein